MVILLTPGKEQDGSLFAAWYCKRRVGEIIQDVASHEDVCALAALEGWSRYKDFGALWNVSGGRTAECPHWFMFDPLLQQWLHASRPHSLSEFSPLLATLALKVPPIS
ncbi:MAG: hypothetical protein FWF12_10590 [Betaproteobacteria bacterium]|nr:hypothetical protein [Betaproteobacteria bacterium]